MRFSVRLIATICFVFAALQAAQAQAGKRVALVMGNSAYLHAPALRNPANDARAIADLLKRTDFDVALKLDLGFDGMRLALRDFGLSTRGAEVAVVYFAGHGLEVGGENYLVPVDAALKSASSVAFEAATLSAVLDAIRPATRLRLVILDACRVNPLAARMELAGGLTRSVPRGLGRIEPTGDVLVAYAAKAGTVAADGKGTHSPYAEALLSTLAIPGLDIRLVMGRVRDLVLAKTRGAQEPFVYGSLGGANVALVSPKTGAPIDASATEAKAARDYELASKVGTKEAWDAFLAAHPTGYHAELAKAQRAKSSPFPPKSEAPTGAEAVVLKAIEAEKERLTEQRRLLEAERKKLALAVPEGPTPVAPKQPAVFVGSVTGAPGDGRTSLRQALQRELSKRGVSVVGGSALSTHRVEGTVTMSEQLFGKQGIHVQWLVKDAHGKRLGAVDQRNDIPSGSLDGPWGRVADQAASAAADGIMKLLSPP